MSTWSDFVDEAEKVIDVLARIERIVGGPVGFLFPQFAPEVAIANTVSAAVDKAYQDHLAAGNSATSAVVALNTIVQGVAASGAIDPATAQKVSDISSKAAEIAPEILRAITDGP